MLHDELLRAADLADVAFVGELYMHDMRAGHYARLNAPPEMMFGQAIADGWLPMSSGPMTVKIVVYTVKGDRAGFAAFKQEPGHGLGERQELWFLSVAPAYRGGGVGSRFFDAACARLSETSAEISARTLEASTRMAEMLSRRGFVHQGRDIGGSLDGPVAVDNWLKIYRRRPGLLSSILAALGRVIGGK